MGRKTDGEKIDELEKTVASLAERVAANRRDAMIARSALSDLSKSCHRLLPRY
jgi:hypothetical protein